MEFEKHKNWIFMVVVIVLVVLLGWCYFSKPAVAATIMEKCDAESTGLKYTNIEGSGFASIFFIGPLLALAPLAGATDTTGQYRCHVAVIGRDAIGAKRKIKNRPVVTPY